jgi:hypothetical protein
MLRGQISGLSHLIMASMTSDREDSPQADGPGGVDDTPSMAPSRRTKSGRADRGRRMSLNANTTAGV